MADGAKDAPFDAVVIGTGFGGAVAACRLAQAGRDICVLERGRRYAPGDFPRVAGRADHLPNLSRWTWALDHGLWDVDDLDGTLAVQAAGYGGGSLVYANVHLRPPREVFAQGWPAVYQSRAALDPYYDLVAAVLRARPLPDEPPPASAQSEPQVPKAVAFEETAVRLGRRGAFFKPALAIDFGKCTNCGGCITGCQVGAKNTLDLNYLATAEQQADLDVRTLAEVDRVEERADHYKVYYKDLITGAAREVRARSVFLCAGAVNSTRILMRSVKATDALPAGGLPEMDPRSKERLGARYFTNSDAFAMVFDTDPSRSLEPTAGPTITGALLYQDPARPPEAAGDGRRDWLLVQDGGYPKEIERLLGFFRGHLWLERNRILTGKGRKPDGRERGPMPGREEAQALVELFSVRDAFFRGHAHPGDPERSQTRLRSLFAEDAPPILPEQVRRMLEALREALAEREGSEADHLSLETLKDVGHRLVASKPALLRPLFAGLFALLRWQVAPFLRASTVAVVNRRVLGAKRGDDPFSPKVLWPLAVQAIEALLFGLPPDDHAFLMLTMGIDQAPGALVLDEGGRLRAQWNLAATSPLSDKQERLMQDIAADLGGELRLNPDATADQRSVTVHSLGGCAMADDPSRGVVNADGLVFGCRALYVLDGAAIPVSLGANPSATIAAVAERNVRRAIDRLFGGSERVEAPVPGQYARYHDPVFPNGASLQEVRDALGQTAAVVDPLSSLQGSEVEIRSHPLGLSFQEAMRGTVTLGGPKPLPIRAELTATIAELNLFLADPRREVRITGVVHLANPVTGADEGYQASGTLELLKKVESWEALAALFERGRAHLAERGRVHAALQARRRAAADPALGEAERASHATEQAVLQAELRDLEAGFDRHLTDLERHPRRYEMDYRLRLSGPVTYQLQGQKRVSDGPGLAPFKDTTTMQVALADAAGKPVGAGVMHVHLADLLGTQVPSFQITGATEGDHARIAWAFGRFFRFFFGTLRQVYLPRLPHLDPFGDRGA